MKKKRDSIHPKLKKTHRARQARFLRRTFSSSTPALSLSALCLRLPGLKKASTPTQRRCKLPHDLSTCAWGWASARYSAHRACRVCRACSQGQRALPCLAGSVCQVCRACQPPCSPCALPPSRALPTVACSKAAGGEAPRRPRRGFYSGAMRAVWKGAQRGKRWSALSRRTRAPATICAGGCHRMQWRV